MSYARKKDEDRYIIDKKTECWEYQMVKDKDGYGWVSLKGKAIRAHRYFYEKYREKIPKGMVIDHLCRNTSCVNPEHLEIVTSYENLIRGKNAKLTVEEVKAIRENWKTENKISMKGLSYLFEISIAQISRIINYKTWKI